MSVEAEIATSLETLGAYGLGFSAQLVIGLIFYLIRRGRPLGSGKNDF